MYYWCNIYQETVGEEDLTTKIRENVKNVVNTAASKILEDIKRLVVSAEGNFQAMTGTVQRDIQNYYEEISALQKRYEETLEKLQSSLIQTGRITEEYNAMVQTYREEVRKLELLNLQIEEVARMQEEYARILEEHEQAVEKEERKVKLTTANGIASRRLGNKVQHETAEILRNIGFGVEEYYGIGQPDYILLWHGKRVAVGAHKAYTLTKDGTRQRTIKRKDIDAEVSIASKLKLPLVIFITNLRNGRRWAEIEPYEHLKEFKKFTTPLILLDDDAETLKICEESLLRLREILPHKAVSKTAQ
ncbi:MAG: hypothetical protein NZ926_02680 [Candidatus Methanomethylicia archaeon]|nr:hypothetical protein [Candidatus Methanomethylicia archaeon]MDW7989037.1 hypothetical protein [Nitrososphaerota archaeon]